MNKINKINVKATITFEVEYFIDANFYDSDIPEEVIAQEQRYVNVNPEVMIDALRHKGTFSGTVELVKND